MSNLIRVIGQDIRQNPMRSLMMEKLIERREGRCGVFWGCHGCDRNPWHVGKHICWCGKMPTKSSCLYGPGLTEEEKAQTTIRQERCAWAEAKRNAIELNPDWKPNKRKKKNVEKVESSTDIFGVLLGSEEVQIQGSEIPLKTM